jgi:FG-GAP-like repeat/Beta xylosidase C-terminal Concanavalin A-like domain
MTTEHTCHRSNPVRTLLRRSLYFLAVSLLTQVVALPQNAAPVSDDFNGSTLDTSLWTVVAPAGGTVTVSNGHADLAVPGGSNHDGFVGGNNSVRILQAITNADFTVAAKFDSIVTGDSEGEGILVQQDSGTYIRFHFASTGHQKDIAASGVSGGIQTSFTRVPLSSATVPLWLRVQRSANTWTLSYSEDGVNYTQAGTFTDILTVSAIGPYAWNYNKTATRAPALTAAVDYFYNVAGTGGTNPPVISAISANPSSTSATITWKTDQPASTAVNYGLTSAYGSSANDPTLVASHSAVLSNLTCNTTYHFQVSSTNSAGQTSTSADQTFTTTACSNPPVISGISANPSTTSASITWTTDQPASTVVNYGLTSAYGSSVNDPTLVTSHSAVLSNLTCNTTYHFQVSSTNSAGQTSTSADQTCNTTACSNPPVISGIGANPSTTSATITWTTDQPASTVVNYGLTTAYGSGVSNPTLVTSHSALLSNLTCNTGYHYEVSSTSAGGQTSTSSDQTFTTGACPAGGPVSDNFDSTTLNTGLWTFVNPTGNAVLTMNGTAATINLPQEAKHDPWTTGDGAVRLMQPISNSDFQVEVRFQSDVEIGNQDEGIIVEQDATDFLRFDVMSDGTNVRIFSAGIKGSTATTFVNTVIPVTQAPIWLQLQRTGNSWVGKWSTNGTNYSTAASFNFTLTVASVGPYAGNANATLANTPAFTAIVDYFFNVASPIANQDGPPPFRAITVDPNPPSTLVEKALADIRGTGVLDPIAGFESPSAGIYWYEYPASGVLTDPWLKHTIVSTGDAYEDMLPLDLNGDGAVDIIASYTPPNGVRLLVWFENPRGSGGDPAVDPWIMHTIGTGTGEDNLILADLDGDGKLDLATGTYIYFQNNADSWTQVQYNSAFRGVATLDIGSGNGRINLVSTSPTSTLTYNAAWFENPRETGGNARTGTWIKHIMGASYPCTSTDCPGGDYYVAVYETGDLNGDQKMDVVMGQSEGPFGVEPPPGGLVWFEAPADRRNGTWIKHTIDAHYTHTHAVRIVDMDKNGTLDLVTSEQDQSTFRRVSVFYNDGLGNFTQEIVSNGAGHQTCVGDIRGGGAIDIFNSGHGFKGMIHPLQIFLNPVP